MDAEQALRNCYERVASGGAIFCTVGPEEAIFPKLSRKLKGKINLGSIHKFYTEVDLISICERNNWKYKELHKTSYDADITSCFDHSSTKGGLILYFLTHCQDFRGTADETFYKDVMTFLEEQSITDDSGKKLIKPEITALVIYQSTNNFASRKVRRDRKLVFFSKIKGNAANNMYGTSFSQPVYAIISFGDICILDWQSVLSK